MKLLIDIHGEIPKRGDLVQTNIGTRRERTCLVIRVRRLKPKISDFRVNVWAERWWELEPDFRMRLHNSAERRGGQSVINFLRYKPQKKPSFEQYMKRAQQG
jgi:hypothetical protein